MPENNGEETPVTGWRGLDKTPPPNSEKSEVMTDQNAHDQYLSKENQQLVLSIKPSSLLPVLSNAVKTMKDDNNMRIRTAAVQLNTVGAIVSDEVKNFGDEAVIEQSFDSTTEFQYLSIVAGIVRATRNNQETKNDFLTNFDAQVKIIENISNDDVKKDFKTFREIIENS